VDLVLGWKEFNGILHFCFLPQGEIKEYPLTLALSCGGERGEKKMKRFKQCTLTLTLSCRVERGEGR
jgi:hypothetical protein